jgi:LPS-assembly protein
MKTTSNILLILLMCCFCASYAWGADQPFPDGNIHIKADSIGHGDSDGIFTANGNVIVTWQGLNIASDKASYDNATRILNASGNVVVTKGNDVMKGESINFNLDNGRGEMERATLTIPDSNLTLTGEKIIRLSETDFEISNSELTTCELPDPSWKFGGDRVKVNVLGYATGRNIVFYIKDVPVLYLPWMAFPVVREKRSGLLFPRLGYSHGRGAQLDIPVYWVISPSQDLLVDLDLLSKRGAGTGIDYRYIRTRGSEGHFGGYQIYDLLQDRWRWQISQNHKEIFSPDMNLRMDVNLNSDRTFLSDFGEKSGEYNRQSSDTTLNALKTWQHYAVTTHLRYVEDLYAPDNSKTLQTLPEIGVAGVRQRLFNTPLYFDIDAGLANLYREALPSGQRLTVFPRVTLLQSHSPYLNASFFVGAHLSGYHTDSGNSGGGIHHNDGILIPETGARLSTSFSRVYQLETTALNKLRHEIIPEITYSYMQNRSQQYLPIYDYTDRQVWQNVAYMSVTSQLNGKFVTGETSEYRDISRIKLLLGHSFEGTRRDLLTTMDPLRPWTDLILESDTWVHRLARLTFDARYNLYDSRIDSSTVGIEFDDKQGNLLGAGYKMSRNDVEYFEGRLSTRLIKPMTLSYSTRYSFDRGGFLESVYSVEYRHKCWSINMALHDRPGNQSFVVNFSLAGLMGKSSADPVISTANEAWKGN